VAAPEAVKYLPLSWGRREPAPGVFGQVIHNHIFLSHE
jgi:hypothetical protein